MASTGKTDRIQGIGASEEDVPKFENNGITRNPEDKEAAEKMASGIAADMLLGGIGPGEAGFPPGLIGGHEYALNTLTARVTELESKLLNLTGPHPPSAATPQTIAATMVGGIFNCPECGLRITSPALIATQGLKTGGYYEHPFDDSPRLAGGKCRLIGKKFKSPIVHLEFVPVVAPKKVDIQETIGV